MRALAALAQNAAPNPPRKTKRQQTHDTSAADNPILTRTGALVYPPPFLSPQFRWPTKNHLRRPLQ
jgi:hypothetical protein